MGNGATKRIGRAGANHLDNIQHTLFEGGRPDFIQTQPHVSDIQPNHDQSQSPIQKPKKPIINGPRHDPISLATNIANNYKEGNVPSFIHPDEEHDHQENEPENEHLNHYPDPNHSPQPNHVLEPSDLSQSQNNPQLKSNIKAKYYPDQVHHEEHNEYDDDDHEEAKHPYDNYGNDPQMHNQYTPFNSQNPIMSDDSIGQPHPNTANHQSPATNPHQNVNFPSQNQPQPHNPNQQLNNSQTKPLEPHPSQLNPADQQLQKQPTQSLPSQLHPDHQQSNPPQPLQQSDPPKPLQQSPTHIQSPQQQNNKQLPSNTQPLQQFNPSQPLQQSPTHIQSRQQENNKQLPTNTEPLKQQQQLKPQLTQEQQQRPPQPNLRQQQQKQSGLQFPYDSNSKNSPGKQQPQSNIQTPTINDSNPTKNLNLHSPTGQPKYNLLEEPHNNQPIKPTNTTQPLFSRVNSLNGESHPPPSNTKSQIDPFRQQPNFQRTLNPLSFASDRPSYNKQNMETPYRTFVDPSVPQSFSNFQAHPINQSPKSSVHNRFIYNHAKNSSINHTDSIPNPKETFSNFPIAKPETQFYNPRHHPDYNPENLPELIIGRKNRNPRHRPFGNDSLVVHPLTQKVGPKASPRGHQRGIPNSSQVWHQNREKNNLDQSIHDASPLLRSTNRNVTPINSSLKELEPLNGRRPQGHYPEAHYSRSFRNSPYQSPYQSQITHDVSGDPYHPQDPMGNYFYTSLAKGEYNRKEPLPSVNGNYTNQSPASGGGPYHHHKNLSIPRIQEDLPFAMQSITPQGTHSYEHSDSLPNVDPRYSEFYGQVDNQEDRITLDPVNTWTGQNNPYQFPSIHLKPVPNTYAPNISFEKSGNNPLLKSSGERTQRSRSFAPSSKTIQPGDHDQFQQTFYPSPNPDHYGPFFKPEVFEPTHNLPQSSKNFNFSSCVHLLTSDATMEHMKRGQALELIINKAKIPSDRVKGKLIKKIYEMDHERAEYLRQPIHIRALSRRFLHNAKLFLTEPLHYLDNFLNDHSPMRLDLHTILDVLLEFFHFMGFFLQNDKFFNYYDRWWRTPRDEDYLNGLTDRLEQAASSLRQDLEETLLKRKEDEDTQLEQAWNYRKVWGGRENKALSTTKQYLNNLYYNMIQKRKILLHHY